MGGIRQPRHEYLRDIGDLELETCVTKLSSVCKHFVWAEMDPTWLRNAGRTGGPAFAFARSIRVQTVECYPSGPIVYLLQ